MLDRNREWNLCVSCYYYFSFWFVDVPGQSSFSSRNLFTVVPNLRALAKNPIIPGFAANHCNFDRSYFLLFFFFIHTHIHTRTHTHTHIGARVVRHLESFSIMLSPSVLHPFFTSRMLLEYG